MEGKKPRNKLLDAAGDFAGLTGPDTPLFDLDSAAEEGTGNRRLTKAPPEAPRKEGVNRSALVIVLTATATVIVLVALSYV